MGEVKKLLWELDELVHYGEGLSGMTEVFSNALFHREDQFDQAYVAAALFLGECMGKYQVSLREMTERLFGAVRQEQAEKA